MFSEDLKMWFITTRRNYEQGVAIFCFRSNIVFFYLGKNYFKENEIACIYLQLEYWIVSMSLKLRN